MASSIAGSSILRLPDATGSVDSCSSGFVRETYKVRIRESILQGRQFRSLTVAEVECRGGILAGVRGNLNNFTLFAPTLADGGSPAESWKPYLQRELPGPHSLSITSPNSVSLTSTASFPPSSEIPWTSPLVRKIPRLLLHPLIEVLVLGWCSHVLVEYICLSLRILLCYIQCLLQRGHTANGGAIGQMVLIPLSGTLDKGYALDLFAIGRTNNSSLSLPSPPSEGW